MHRINSHEKRSSLGGGEIKSDQGSKSLLTLLTLTLLIRSFIQEFWVDNEELVEMYNARLGDAGYINFKLPSTNGRGDGLLIAGHKDYFHQFHVIDHRDQLFNDFGDCVAQLLHVEMLIVNTHLLFPHNSSMCLERLRQLLDPSKYRKVLGWSDAVFGLFKYLVSWASLTGEDAFTFLKAVSDWRFLVKICSLCNIFLIWLFLCKHALCGCCSLCYLAVVLGRWKPIIPLCLWFCNFFVYNIYNLFYTSTHLLFV